MSVYKGISLDNLVPDTIRRESEVVIGKLATPQQPYLQETGETVVLADNTYAAIKLAQRMSAEKKWEMYHRHQFESHKIESGWTAGHNWEESINLLTCHPQDLYSVSEDNSQILEPESSGNNIYYNVTGDYLDVGRYLDGEPEVFGNTSDGKQSVKYINFIIGNSCKWSISSSQILRTCTALSQLIDWLEFNNVRCRVTVVYTDICSHFETRLKDYHDVLNANEIKIGLSPDYFRRIEFVFSEYSDTWQSGYGTAHSISSPEVIPDEGALNVVFNAQDVHERSDKQFKGKMKEIKGRISNLLATPVYKGKIAVVTGGDN